MVAKWQNWMPFYIDAFMGSPAVQAMHPTARIGYLCLLARAWQTEDCTIPSDDLMLAEMSGIGDEFWAAYRERILRKFDQVDGTDRLRNAVLYEKWKDARRIYERRRESAERTNSERSPSRKSSRPPQEPLPFIEREPSRPADTVTGTVTVTGTEIGGTSPAPDEPTATVTAYDFNADPLENIPEGLAMTQYADFILRELHVAAGYGLKVKTGDVVALLAEQEACGHPEATRRLLGRMGAAAAAGPVKWLFWLEDGNWKEPAAFSIGIEDPHEA